MSEATVFKSLEDKDLALVYESLCVMIRVPEGSGFFHNGDRGSPVYRGSGMQAFDRYADSPEKNRLFRLGHEAYREGLRRSKNFFQEHFQSVVHPFNPAFVDWPSFCREVTAVYDQDVLENPKS
jgi:hypothetical protein